MKGRTEIFLEVGSRYGRLVVVEMTGARRSNSRLYGVACDCGTTKLVAARELRSRHTLSCGCLQREQRTTHGQSRSPEYIAWKSMRARCSRPAGGSYKNYGGRGITVCADWMSSFESFLRDMGARPSPKHSIDRIDVDGPYCKENCRWATPDVQSRNRRHLASKTGAKGVHPMPNGRDFKVNLTVDNKTVHVGVYPDVASAVVARSNAEREMWGDKK